MHILESFALQNDLKIDRPFVYERFFPLAVEKFITLDTSSLGTEAMKYDHWQLVVDLIQPFLEEQQIKIVQLGAKNDPPLTGCYIALGQCNFNQKAYVINKGLAHVSTNNEAAHIASTYNKKSVVIFPHNCYPQQFLPYWTEQGYLEILYPQMTSKPSFNPSETPKSINLIAPESIAGKILKSVGMLGFVPEFRTLKIGGSFHRKRIESTLTRILDPAELGVSSLIVRMDLNFNEEGLVKQLEASPCSVITNRPFNKEILNKFSKRIVELVYYIERGDEGLDFISKVKEKSINYLLRSRAEDDEIKDFKMTYFDYGLVNHVSQKTKHDYAELKNKKKLYYKSNHFIIHNNSFYPSTAALLRDIHGKPTMEHEPFEAIEDPLFWEEEEHFHFFEKK